VALTSCQPWQYHYREAERLIADMQATLIKRPVNDTDKALIDIARVHALLATVRLEPQITDHMLTQ
jgi:hypothetical protein